MKPFDRAQTAAELVTNKSIKSLVEQLQNRIMPENLQVFKTPHETTAIINKHLNEEIVMQKKTIEAKNNEIKGLKNEKFSLENEARCWRCLFCLCCCCGQWQP